MNIKFQSVVVVSEYYQADISLKLQIQQALYQYSICSDTFSTHFFSYSTVELHFFGLIGTESHSDIQKIRKLDFFLKIGYIGNLKFGCYYLQYVPASKPFSHARFEVLEAITV
jgi:hypothetical protein